ncbi:MAG TPA: L-seryl-tRNA(Sec) selenium transferase, partial [Blastocatellia bacterium]|nr:L-seryl-tRNA(Sec) selenium transferase [Blastocatellia bacterium]
IIGFTERPSAQEISDLARRAHIPSFEDLGSGCLIDLEPFGVRDEPVVSRALEAGISVVSFSGDKMLGGPQAGVIAGSREVIERVRKNPLMRALRVDKMTYAALEATLRLYERGVSESEVPVLRALTATREQVGERASRMASRILEMTGGRVKAGLEDGDSVVGGGSAPEVKLPTVLIAIEDESLSASSIEARLRAHRVPVIARTERDQVLLDLRTVEPGEESIILEALSALGEPASNEIASIEG